MTALRQHVQMVQWGDIMKMFRILLVFLSLCNAFFALQAQAVVWNYSSNPADYDFGWFANGTYAPGSEPYCSYCVNALSYDPEYFPTPADLAQGFYWNRTVGTYRCDGVEPNEFWAFHDPTQTIVFGNLTEGNVSSVLCIDAVDYVSLGRSLLKLRPCNSSSVSQQWRKNGSRVVSALLGPEGEELVIVGRLPNKITNPNNLVYAYDLTLESSLPNASSPGISYTWDFTFLSSAGLVNSSSKTFTAEGLLKITNNSLSTIVNGGFERSTIQAGTEVSWSDYTQGQPSYFSLCGWVIDSGPIDYVKAALLPPAEGSYSLHLNTHSDTEHWGQVSQTIITVAGAQYFLSFAYNGFPPHVNISTRPSWSCGPTYDAAKMKVALTPASLSPQPLPNDDLLYYDIFLNVTNSNSSNFGSQWSFFNLTFFASTNVTTISFSSLNVNSSCGPMIDQVALESAGLS